VDNFDVAEDDSCVVLRTLRRRASRASWLKVAGLTPVAVAGLFFVIGGSDGGGLALVVLGVVLCASAFVGWRRPLLVASLLFVLAAIGTLLVVGATIVSGNSAGGLLIGLLFLGGLPFVSGSLLLYASLGDTAPDTQER
jgi:hypothetical protein